MYVLFLVEEKRQPEIRLYVTQANFILEQISIISTLPYGGCKAYLIGQVGQVRNNVIISEDT